MGAVDQMEFEKVKQKVLLLSPKQRKELEAVIGLTKGERATAQSSPGMKPEDALHRHLQGVLATRQGRNDVPSLATMRRHSPAIAARVAAAAKELDRAIDKHFPKTTKTQFEALRLYFLNMAANRVEDMERAVTLSLLLDVLLPFEELVDDQLPGYRASGILQQVILNKITGGKQCLDRTP